MNAAFPPCWFYYWAGKLSLLTNDIADKNDWEKERITGDYTKYCKTGGSWTRICSLDRRRLNLPFQSSSHRLRRRLSKSISKYFSVSTCSLHFKKFRTAIRAEITLLWTNHIRVLTSANHSYLIIGFKQPIKFNKNVLWQMSTKTKNLHMSWTI
jgi:hypothetical protein